MTPEPNSSLSKVLPTLQLGIDSTSLGAFKVCPRYYQLSILEGWQPRSESVHLTFGLLVHRAREVYDHARSDGLDHDEALDRAMDDALRATWNAELSRPWISDHKVKNRLSLLRTIVWYLDAFGRDDPIQTLQLANGRPAVELSFRFDSGFRSISTDEPFLLCGHLDRVGELGNENYVIDIKTTSSEPGGNWIAKFSPGNQFSLYALAAKVAFGFPVRGVIVDGIQVGVTFSRFNRGPVPRSDEFLSEWLKDTGVWLRGMEACAIEGYWPMNDKSCDMYGGCQFREICARSPISRDKWLAAEFTKRVWDPLKARGEI